MSSQTTPVNSPQPISLSPNQSSKKENLEEKLGSPFEPFNVGNVISSFDDESTKLSQFEGEFNEMLLSTMLEVRAWALARPIVERDTTEDALATQVGELQKIQDEQEQTRLKLLNFISSIKTALAALTTGSNL